MDATRPEPDQLVRRPGDETNRAQDCRHAPMNVTDELEQTARNIAAARSIDVDNASSIAPRDTEEVKNKSEGGKGMGRIPGFNLAEDSRGRGLSKMGE